LSLEGVLSDSKDVKVFYFKETISLHEIKDGEWEEGIIYKFYFKIEKPCLLRIFLPFSIEEIEWKQKSIRNKDFQMKVSHVTKFEALERDIFRIGFYEDLQDFTVFLPTDEQMAEITSVTMKKTRYLSSTEITINLDNLGFEKNYFREKECGFGIMFKVRTREFLSKENARRIGQVGEIWNLNVQIYPVTSILTVEQQKNLILIEDTDIWVVLPKNTTIASIYPNPKSVITLREEDEAEEEKYASISSFKTYEQGQNAICWDLKNIKREESVYCFVETSERVSLVDFKRLEAETINFRKTLEMHNDNIERLGERMINVESDIKKLDQNSNELSKNFDDLLKNMPNQYVTIKDMLTTVLTIVILFIAVFAAFIIFK